MSERHFYFGIELLTMTDVQKQRLITEAREKGKADADAQPARRNHWRVRRDADGNIDAAIHDGVFEDGDLTIAAVKGWLVSIFGVAVGTVSHATATPTFATRPSVVVTFAHSNVNRLRMVVFGGTGASREESRIEAVAYVAANAVAWGDA